jgi:hypothetical protein
MADGGDSSVSRSIASTRRLPGGGDVVVGHFGFFLLARCVRQLRLQLPAERFVRIKLFVCLSLLMCCLGEQIAHGRRTIKRGPGSIACHR